MRFSTHSNNTFKEFFKSNEKDKIIADISREKEMIRSEIKDFINNSYSAPVDACDSLDLLTEKIDNLKMINNEVERVSKELISDLNENKEQESDLKQCLDRISILQKEIIKISRFLDILVETENFISKNTSNSFVISKNMEFLDETLKGFQNYFFFISFRDRIENIKEKLKEHIENTIDEFLNQDWTEIGRNLTVDESFQFFDDIREQESMLNPTKILDSIYYSKIFPKYIENMIDNKRKSIFQKVESKKNEEIIHFYIGNIFLSGFLQKFVQIESFFSHIFTKIPEMSSVDINACGKLKKLVNKIGIMSEDLNYAIMTIVYVYFDENFRSVDLNKLSETEIIKKIEGAISDLKSVNSYENEFDEIFLKKMDDSLIYILNNSDENVFFKKLNEVKNILSKLKTGENSTSLKAGENSTSLKTGDYPFEVKYEIERSISRIANKKLEGLKNLSAEEVVKRIVEWKNVDSTDFKSEIIKIIEERSKELFSNYNDDERILFIDTARRNLQ